MDRYGHVQEKPMLSFSSLPSGPISAFSRSPETISVFPEPGSELTTCLKADNARLQSCKNTRLLAKFTDRTATIIILLVRSFLAEARSTSAGLRFAYCRKWNKPRTGIHP